MSRNRLAALATVLGLLAVGGCTHAEVGQHTAAKDYASMPKRMFIVNRLDTSFHATMPADFEARVVPLLARCGIVATTYKPSALELDAEAKAKSALEAFNPDVVLNISQTRRGLMDGDVRFGDYSLVLYDVARKRAVWRAGIGTGSSARFLVNRGRVGAKFADEVVRTMVADNVIKTCPPLPSGSDEG